MPYHLQRSWWSHERALLSPLCTPCSRRLFSSHCASLVQRLWIFTTLSWDVCFTCCSRFAALYSCRTCFSMCNFFHVIRATLEKRKAQRYLKEHFRCSREALCSKPLVFVSRLECQKRSSTFQSYHCTVCKEVAENQQLQLNRRSPIFWLACFLLFSWGEQVLHTLHPTLLEARDWRCSIFLASRDCRRVALKWLFQAKFFEEL